MPRRAIARLRLLACLLVAGALLAAPASALGGRIVWSRALASVESLLGGHPPRPADLVSAARMHGRRHGRSGRELTPALAALALHLRALPAAERHEARRLLARPTDGDADPQQNGYTVHEASGSPYCSAHFCVHWVSSTSDAPDLTDNNHNGVPDWVETVASVAENVYTVENGQLGWRTPKGDGTLGGSFDKTDIYLKDLAGTGEYGYTAPDPSQVDSQPTSNSLYAYLVIDNDFSSAKFPSYASPVTPLEVTLAHEYDHVLQFAYDGLADTWLMESTAVWMEGKVYPAAHDYLQYLPGWVSLTQVPMTTFDGNNPNNRSNVKVYGSSVWNKWLDAAYGQDVIRGVWEDSTRVSPGSFAPAAYDASIRAHHGVGFFDAFSRFSAATADWGAENSGFPDGALYPDVKRIGTLSVDGDAGVARLDHATFALIDVPPANVPRAKLVVKAPAGVASAIALVARVGAVAGGAEYPSIVELRQGGLGAVTVQNPGADARLTAVLVDGDVTQTGYSQALGDWAFADDNEPYTARITTDFTAPRAGARSPRPGARGVSTRARISVRFSKAVTGVSTRSVRLLAPGRRPVRIRVRLARGARAVVIAPLRQLRRGVRYVVELGGSITDDDANRLSRTSWRFVTAG